MKYIDTEKNGIVFARKKFAAMAGTYCLGVFNDNFFKQAVLLVALTTGMDHLQGLATALFALPFVLFSSWGGWLSDRYAKRNVIMGAKALEVAAMIAGAAGLITGNWWCVLAMVFLMGTQSAFFSPALNGAIPELYPADYVPKANAVIKLFTTLAILAGIAFAGIFLDQQWVETAVPFGRLLVGGIVVAIALAGFALSFGVYSKKASGIKPTVPWLGPVNSLKELKEICRDRQLFLAISADAYFYFLASVVILAINSMGLGQLGLTQTVTSLMSMSLMAGVCLGSMLAAKIISMSSWFRYLGISSCLMGCGLLFAGLSARVPVGIQAEWLAAALIATGIAGGLFLIPVTSFLQLRPEAAGKGRVLAAANFCGFTAILASGFIFNLFSLHFSASTIIILFAVLSLASGVIFSACKIAKSMQGRPMLSWILRRILSLRYSIEIRGVEELQVEQGRGILFLPNHPALIDPVIVMSILMKKFRPRPLSDADQANKPVNRQLMRLVNPITLPDLHKTGRSGRLQVKKALQTVIDTLREGEQIILYPAGRLYRSSLEQLSANSAVQTVVKKVPDVQIVLVKTTGLWGSSFSRATASDPTPLRCLGRYLIAMLAGGLFFMPKRKVVVEVKRDTKVTCFSERLQINRHLESFYNSEVQPNTFVPYFWWQGRKHQVVDEPCVHQVKGDIIRVSSTIKEQVKIKLGSIVGRAVKEGELLADDLAVDSLMLMELVDWLESEFGVPIGDSSVLRSVDDCILAACG